MTELAAAPTHFRLLTALRAIGPYLRESDSNEGHYLFDCLSVCVNDKKSPEEREFWGWWMELDALNEQSASLSYVANFRYGIYNKDGKWDGADVPKKAQPEVARTQSEFVVKLKKVLLERFEIELLIHEESEEIS
ncbi:sigma factor-binding protein Crl [Vibrio sp. SCSIO 43137]|uniref:sigma factor-binding protein Crl n=1 Tax=Vibrio sp. SCSIO 43137 TaxID=3021011 RepID=UPI0023080E31|nr:sigma factor-binding protein Crl [Vibrio sp. SCSIO 43137]WCE30375.1 sigma factor-binding protein Crl [Vibrio sp. SCSIO 43137]